MVIDLSLTNQALYKGCEVETVAGRLNLKTPITAAVETVGANVHDILATVPAEERREVTLTGPMAVWAYLIVFHAAVHRFDRVYYNDGRSGPVLIAAHGPGRLQQGGIVPGLRADTIDSTLTAGVVDLKDRASALRGVDPVEAASIHSVARHIEQLINEGEADLARLHLLNMGVRLID